VHIADPGSLENVPAGQLLHLIAPESEYLPALHFSHFPL
jgi:hypothetical protein